MPVSITTKARYTAAQTVARVRDRLGLSTSRNTEIGEVIDEITSTIETEIGRPLPRQTYLEEMAGLGGQTLNLARWPLDPDSLTVTVQGTAVTDYEIMSVPEGRLWRATGWPTGSWAWDSASVAAVSVAYRAGYVMPGAISTWAVATVYSVGQWVRPSIPTLSPLLMECTTAGTSHASTEPTWTSVAGATKTDGTATWTQRTAVELPGDIQRVCFLACQRALTLRASDVASMSIDTISESYFPVSATGGGAFTLPESMALAGYRRL